MTLNIYVMITKNSQKHQKRSRILTNMVAGAWLIVLLNFNLVFSRDNALNSMSIQKI